MMAQPICVRIVDLRGLRGAGAGTEAEAGRGIEIAGSCGRSQAEDERAREEDTAFLDACRQQVVEGLDEGGEGRSGAGHGSHG